MAHPLDELKEWEEYFITGLVTHEELLEKTKKNTLEWLTNCLKLAAQQAEQVSEERMATKERSH